MGILRTGIATLDIQGNNLIYFKELDNLRILLLFLPLPCEIGILKIRGFLRKTSCTPVLFGGLGSGPSSRARSSFRLPSFSCDKGELRVYYQSSSRAEGKQEALL